MSYFLIPENLDLGKEYKVTGDEARHILLSRRVKSGERVNLQGPDGRRFSCEVLGGGKNSLSVRTVSAIMAPKEPVVPIVLFQALVGEQALDFILQKGTELGADKVVLFNSANTARRLSKEQFSRKQARWHRILWEAAKQCDRQRPSGLEFAGDTAEAVGMLVNYGQVLLFDPAGDPLKAALFDARQEPLSSCAIIIGPEGGLEKEEVEKFGHLPHCRTASLGSILLRAETAALAALAVCRISLP